MTDYLNSPLTITPGGRTATADVDAHVRELVELVLFTRPGERVNLPEFGCGIRELLFAPNSDLLATATEALTASSLNRWLSDWLVVQKLEVMNNDNVLEIRVTYQRRGQQEMSELVISR